MGLFAVGLILFLGMHSVRIVAPGLRQTMIGRLGEGGWKGLYSVVSLLGLVLIVLGYPDAKITLGVVWSPPLWTKHLAVALMLPAFMALAAMYGASKLRARLKHPMLVAIKIWALAHLLANGLGVQIVLFAAFLVWAIADRVSVKRRGEPDPVAPAGWIGDLIAIAVGTLAWLAMIVWLHQWLFGVAPIG